MKATSASVGAEIKRRREEQGLTLRDLGERTGVHPFHIPAIEKGEVDAFLSTLKRIAQGLGCQVGDFFPVEPMSKEAIEVGKLFDKGGPELQPGMLAILGAIPRKGGRS